MKTLPILLCLLPLLLVRGVAEEKSAVVEPKKPDVKAEMANQIRREFPFIARPAEKVAEEVSPVSKQEIIVMNPYNVREGYRGLEELLERNRKKQAKEKFDLQRGGTIYKAGPVELKFFDNPEHQNFGKVPPGGKAFIDLLKISF